MKGLALLLLVVPLAGCAALMPEGEETLTIRNGANGAITALVSIEQEEGGFVVFRQEVFLERGAADEFVVAMRPGAYLVDVATSTGIFEKIRLELPSRGDTAIEVLVLPRSASITTRSA